MKVLVYVRPWAITYFKRLCAAAFPGATIVAVSDFRGLADYDLSEGFTRRMRRGLEGVRWPAWVTGDDEYQILARNYFLRAQKIEMARLYASSMAGAIQDAVDTIAPDAIVSMSGDNYVLDLLGRYGHLTGRPVCGLIPCPFRGYTRVTMRGEYTAFRSVSNEEADAAVAIMRQPGYKPLDLTDWLNMYGSLVTFKRAAREKPKRFVFPVIAQMRRDPFNYHYGASALSRVSLVSQTLLIERFFEKGWRGILESSRRPAVYLPLPAYPEATTDYHVAQLDLTDFTALLFEIVEQLDRAGDLVLLLKEHPGMMGARPPGFYARLKQFPSVVLVSGNEATVDVIDRTAPVLTWTGTSGLEASVRGKPVVTLGRPYYSCGPSFREILSRRELPRLADLVRESAAGAVPPDTPRLVAKQVLASCLPGEFRQLGFDESEERVREIEQLGAAMRTHWQSWTAQFPTAFATHLAGQPTAGVPTRAAVALP